MIKGELNRSRCLLCLLRSNSHSCTLRHLGVNPLPMGLMMYQTRNYQHRRQNPFQNSLHRRAVSGDHSVRCRHPGSFVLVFRLVVFGLVRFFSFAA